jgi:hypothetical protein
LNHLSERISTYSKWLTDGDACIGNYMTDHKGKIRKRLARVMRGREMSEAAPVSKQYLLDIERKPFERDRPKENAGTDRQCIGGR